MFCRLETFISCVDLHDLTCSEFLLNLFKFCFSYLLTYIYTHPSSMLFLLICGGRTRKTNSVGMQLPPLFDPCSSYLTPSRSCGGADLQTCWSSSGSCQRLLCFSKASVLSCSMKAACWDVWHEEDELVCLRGAPTWDLHLCFCSLSPRAWALHRSEAGRRWRCLWVFSNKLELTRLLPKFHLIPTNVANFALKNAPDLWCEQKLVEDPEKLWDVLSSAAKGCLLYRRWFRTAHSKLRSQTLSLPTDKISLFRPGFEWRNGQRRVHSSAVVEVPVFHLEGLGGILNKE